MDPRHHPGQSTLIWPNGCKALLFSAEDPEVTRGASGSFFWWDELAKARRSELGWSNMMFGMREGNPRGIVTTTPKPVPILKKLLKARAFERLDHLAIEDLAQVRTGRQEINAEMIDDLPGALWTRAMIDKARETRKLPDFNRVVVAVDPSGARTMSNNAASAIGIVVTGRGVDGRGYVRADRSCKMSPAGCGKRACDAYHEFGADRLVAERNFGGAMVE